MFLLASPTVSGMFPGVTGISGSALHGTCLLPDILGISAECEIPDGGGVESMIALAIRTGSRATAPSRSRHRVAGQTGK
jgi:hypothetical protein